MPLGDGVAAGAIAGDIALSDELLAALPRDPYEQLDLARRITALAVAGRVSGLEREAGRLRAEAAGKDRENGDLRERVALLDTQDTNARLRAIKLSKERDSLAQTSKKLARDLQKFDRLLASGHLTPIVSQMDGYKINIGLVLELAAAPGAVASVGSKPVCVEQD